MSERTYDQYCPVARAMEFLGERWTLLIIRELATGPKRFTDLMERLPAIGAAVLAKRTRNLEQANVIAKRKLPPPASSRIYELTRLGEELRPAIVHLAEFGAHFMDRYKADQHHPIWIGLTLLARFQSNMVGDLDEDVEFRVANEVFHLQIQHDQARIELGAAYRPTLTLVTDVQGLQAFASGQATHQIQWIGSPKAKANLFQTFDIHELHADL